MPAFRARCAWSAFCFAEATQCIVVMNRGRIEQVDVPDTVYRRPESVFVADFIGRATFLDATLLAEPADGRARVVALGREFETDCQDGVTIDTEVLLMIRPESVRLSERVEAEEVHGDIGRVLNAIFHGDGVEYEIETDTGTIVAQVSDPSVEDILKPMDCVRVSLAQDRGWLLPKTDYEDDGTAAH